MKKGYDLGNEPVVGLCFKLAIPAMIAQLVSVLYNIIDRLFIANIPIIGDEALAGVGITGPIVTLLSSFGTLIGIGGSIYMAMSLGEENQQRAEQILSNSFQLLAGLSLILTLSFLLIKNPMLHVFGATEAIFDYANTYMSIYVAGTFFALMAIGLNSFAICQGFPRKAMTTVIIGAVLNIVLDYLFIVKFDYGVAGAATATVLAQMASCAYILIFLFSKQVSIKVKFHKVSGNICRQVIALGMSPFIILLTDSVLIILMNMSLKAYGGNKADLLLASVTIMQSFLLIITGPMIGITGGTQALISYNYGARKYKRILHSEYVIASMCLVLTSVMFVVAWCFGDLFVKIFTSDPIIITMATKGIRVFTLMIIPLALQYTFVDGLTALGKTKIALSLSLTRKSLFLLGVIGLPLFFNAESVFYAEPLCDGIAAVITSCVFVKQWRMEKYVV